MQFKRITGYHNLWFWLDEQTDKLDLNKSLVMQKHNFATKDGEEHYTPSYYHSFDKFEELFGIRIDSKLSTAINNTHFTLALLGDEDEASEIVIANVESEEDTQQEVEESASVLTSFEPEVSKEVEKVPDWKWIESLENTPDDRLSLDNYAAEEFSVKLSRRKTIANMIKDFKEELQK